MTRRAPGEPPKLRIRRPASWSWVPKGDQNQRIDNPKDDVCISFGSDPGTILGNTTDRRTGAYRDGFGKKLITIVAPRGSARYQGAPTRASTA